MLKSIQWDIYTVLMIGLVPVLLVSAWGLTQWDDIRLHRAQCEVAESWLEENTEIASDFAQTRTLQGTGYWQTRFEAINWPSDAGQLRWGIIQSANYGREHYPSRFTSFPAVLNPEDGLFSRDISQGRKNLVERCPEVESMLPDAFPMIFQKEEPT